MVLIMLARSLAIAMMVVYFCGLTLILYIFFAPFVDPKSMEIVDEFGGIEAVVMYTIGSMVIFLADIWYITFLKEHMYFW